MISRLKQLAAGVLLVAFTMPSAVAQTETKTKATTKKKTVAKPVTVAVTSEDIKALRDALAAQQAQIQELRQQLTARDEASRKATDLAQQAQSSANDAASKAATAETVANEKGAAIDAIKAEVADVKLNQQNAALSTQDDQKRIASAEALLGRFRMSGDVRVRGEFFHQKYDGCAACFDRWRARIRARFGFDGKLNEDFTAGIFMATGAVVNGAPDFKDPVSTNETLTSNFERKTIGLDRAWITYNPAAHKWLNLTGGKFAYNWQRTTLTFDPDLNPDGFSEKLSFDLTNKVFRNVTVQGLQFLFNEVSGGRDSNAIGAQFLTRLQLGKRVTITPSYTALNWNGADAIAQAAFPVTLPQPNTPAVGTPLPQPTAQPVRTINANAFTNASVIVGVGGAQKRAFVSGFFYNDFIVDSNIKTNWEKWPIRLLFEYEKNSRARIKQDDAFWVETSIGQQKDRFNWLFGYSYGHIQQDAVISQFNESDMRAPTNVLQHRLYINWLVAKNLTAAGTLWIGRTLDVALQNAAKAPGLPAGQSDPYLKRLQMDLIYRF